MKNRRVFRRKVNKVILCGNIFSVKITFNKNIEIILQKKDRTSRQTTLEEATIIEQNLTKKESNFNSPNSIGRIFHHNILKLQTSLIFL